MSHDNQDTQQLLIDSFIDLMLETPFNKITIKMITDRAGVIRPTFYNHFQDKYELFDIILQQDLFNTLYDLVDIELYPEALKMIFTYFEKHAQFYQRCFESTGLNSFENTLTEKFIEFNRYILERRRIKPNQQIDFLSAEQIAEFYAYGLVLLIKIWLNKHPQEAPDANQVLTAYQYLVTHNIADLFEDNK